MMFGEFETLAEFYADVIGGLKGLLIAMPFFIAWCVWDERKRRKEVSNRAEKKEERQEGKEEVKS